MQKALETAELITSDYSKNVFKNLCKCIAELITTTSNNKNEKPDLFLYFNQLLDCLQLLAQVISEEYDKEVILKECRRSIQNRIVFCLRKIESIDSKSPTKQLGCFINWMNNALEHIKNINNLDPMQEFNKAKSLIEKILLNALSVAQIALDEDSKAIKGSCQSVLDSLQSLETQLQQDESNAMLKIFCDTCTTKLCSLERRLDMAILRLTLEVFTNNPLDKSFEGKNLDEFDLYIDRFMQIGLFATFCSSNIESGISLLNSMANIEYLEQEFVPSVMVMLRTNDEIFKLSASIYKNYWEDELIKFKKLLFGIIDARAFSSMVKEEIGQLIDKTQKTQPISKETFIEILNPALLLLDFMSIASKNEQFNNSVPDRLERIRLVTRELSNGIEILHEPLGTNQRLLKRCKILKAEIQRLVLELKIEESINSTEFHEEFEVKDYSVSLHSLDRKGKHNLENRSILYRTQRVATLEPGEHNHNLKTHLDFPEIVLSFRSKIENLTTELNITEILNGLNELSTS